jgi:hypothetical protein
MIGGVGDISRARSNKSRGVCELSRVDSTIQQLTGARIHRSPTPAECEQPYYRGPEAPAMVAGLG